MFERVVGETVVLVLVERLEIVGRVLETPDEVLTDALREALPLIRLLLILLEGVDVVLAVVDAPLLPTILSPVLEELLILRPGVADVPLLAVVRDGVLP